MNKLMLWRNFNSCSLKSSTRLFKSFGPRSGINGAAQEGGMTLLEMVLAMSMLVVFTGVMVMVMQFINRFFVDAQSDGKGVLIEHAEIQIDMDRLVEVLSQPGIAYTHVKTFSSLHQDNLPPTCVVSGGDIALAWNLPMPSTSLTPDRYSLCLWSTFPLETVSTPGIYVLHALPDKISASKLPIRRIFCRPRHLC